MSELPPATELMTVIEMHGKPTLAEAAKDLGVATEDLDAAFGVVPVDPERGIYAVLVQAGRAPKQTQESGRDFRGPWSDPAIMPFGPVQHEKKKDND